MQVAVYGSLMSGLYNYEAHLHNKSEYVGQFQTEPKFDLYDLQSFPALVEGGSTSVVMEVYDVDDIVLQSLDNLEGYRVDDPDSSYYKRELIKTPYGEAYCYFFNNDIDDETQKVNHGNWKLHYTSVRKRKK